MSEETLLSAARRLVRYINIDNERSGGLISNETCWANEQLARMVDLEAAREKAAQDAKEKINAPDSN